MSEEIGLQRHVAFTDPRLERSTAVKCTEADHYISTTARSDICVLLSASLYLSHHHELPWELGLWTKTLFHLQSSFPVFRMDSNNVFLSILADPPFLFEIHFLPLPYCFSLYSFSFSFDYCVCVWDINRGLSGSRLCLNQFCSIGAVPFFNWSAWEDVQRRGRKCGCTSIKSLVCPLWCYAAMHFSYKEAKLLSLRIEVKDTELFLSSQQHITTSQSLTPCTAGWWLLTVPFRRLELLSSWVFSKQLFNRTCAFL